MNSTTIGLGLCRGALLARELGKLGHEQDRRMLQSKRKNACKSGGVHIRNRSLG
ncbi:MAG: hypothetical protein ACREV1_01965 [Gammaproteobacteria bacterium]